MMHIYVHLYTLCIYEIICLHWRHKKEKDKRFRRASVLISDTPNILIWLCLDCKHEIRDFNITLTADRQRYVHGKL